MESDGDGDLGVIALKAKADGPNGWRRWCAGQLAVMAMSDAPLEDGEPKFPPTVTVVHGPSADGG